MNSVIYGINYNFFLKVVCISKDNKYTWFKILFQRHFASLKLARVHSGITVRFYLELS